ncbi:MAG: tetratricopeptide repeat protein [Candidatus Hydrothermia bacterium]
MSDIRKEIERRVSKYLRLGDFRGALRELETYRRVFRSKDLEKYYFLKGYISLKAGDVEKASKTFKVLTRAYPKKSIYQFFAGVSNLELANYEESLSNLRKAFELAPENREYKKNFGWALVMNGKKQGLKILRDLFYTEPFQKDLTLKYIVALIKFNEKPQALWLSRLSFRKLGDAEFQELVRSLEDEIHSQSMFLTRNEEKVIILLTHRSGYDEETIDELTILFLALKNSVFKRIVNPFAWAAALEVAGRTLKGDISINFKAIEKKYGVNYKQVNRILSKIFSGGIVDE